MRESRQTVWHKKHPDESHRGVRIRCSVDTSRLVSELDFLTFRDLWLLEEQLEADCRQECKDLVESSLAGSVVLLDCQLAFQKRSLR